MGQYTAPFGGRQNAESFVPAAPAPKKRRARNAIRAVLGLGLGGGLAFGGWYAYGVVSNGGPQPDSVITADAAAYVRLDLDPSLSQKVSLAKIVHNETGKKVKSNNDLPSLVADALSLKECGLTYDQDIKPWIGQRFAGAAVPGDKGALVPLVAIQTSDEDLAAKTLSSLNKCPALSGMASVVGSGYVVITQAGVAANTAEKVLHGDAPALADNQGFQDSTQALGDQGFASFWVKPDPILEAINGVLATDSDQNSVKAVTDSAPAVSVAGVLRATNGHGLELPIQVQYKPGKAPQATAPASAMNSVPATAEFAVALPPMPKGTFDQDGINSLIPFSAFGNTPANNPSDGLTLALETVFSTDTVLFGGGLDTDAAEAGGWGGLFTKVAASKVQAVLGHQTLVPASEMVVTEAKGGGTLIGQDTIINEQFAEGQRLVDTDKYRKVLDQTDGAVLLGFLDVAALDPHGSVEAVGVQVSPPKGDVQTSTIRVSLK